MENIPIYLKSWCYRSKVRAGDHRRQVLKFCNSACHENPQGGDSVHLKLYDLKFSTRFTNCFALNCLLGFGSLSTSPHSCRFIPGQEIAYITSIYNLSRHEFAWDISTTLSCFVHNVDKKIFAAHTPYCSISVTFSYRFLSLPGISRNPWSLPKISLSNAPSWMECWSAYDSDS